MIVPSRVPCNRASKKLMLLNNLRVLQGHYDTRFVNRETDSEELGDLSSVKQPSLWLQPPNPKSFA